MPRPEKVAAVEAIRARLESAEAVFLTEYRGLSVPAQQQLRNALREAGAEFKVMKMSLARLAAAELGLDELAEDMLGPTAIAFADAGPVPAAKALKDFAGEHEVFVVKSGLMSGAVLTPEAVIKLAEIEPLDVLLSKIAGAAKAPLYKTATLLSAMLRNSASAFSQLLEKKEADGPAEPAEAGEEADEPAPDAEGADDSDADSADSPDSPDSVDSPDSPDSVDSPEEADDIEPEDDAEAVDEEEAEVEPEAEASAEPEAESELDDADSGSESEPETESAPEPTSDAEDASDTDNESDTEN